MFELNIQTPSELVLKQNLSLWLQADFLKAVEILQQVEALYLICRKGEQIVALMPIFEKKNLGLRRLIHPVSSYYQGLWFFWEQGREENRNLLDELHLSTEVAKFLKDRYKRIQFNLTPYNCDVRGFTWSGLKAKPLYTFVHKTSEPVNVLKDERKKLRSVQKQEFLLEEDFQPDTFITMLKELNRRKELGFSLSYTGYQKWMVFLHEKKLLTQFNLLKGSEIVSTNLVLGGRDDKTGYSIMRCTRLEEMKSGASAVHSLLLAEKLKDRFEWIDFCGGNNPEVARFKAALGFSLRTFYQISN